MPSKVDIQSDAAQSSSSPIFGAATPVRASIVLPISNIPETLTALLQLASRRTGRLVVAGHATPDLAICANRADLTLSENVGASPFSADPESMMASIKTTSDCVFISNPNRVTGTLFSLADLKRAAEAVPDGLLIVDEYYYDLCGISAVPLLNRYDNIVVIRSITPRTRVESTDAGYMITSPRWSNLCREHGMSFRAGTMAENSLIREFAPTSELLPRLKELHAETLRLGSTLTRFGAQCRISPTDFLLVRVACPAEVGNHLASYGISVDNLDGFAGLRNYVRIQIRSAAENDKVIEAFSRLTRQVIDDRTPEKRSIRLRRQPESSAAHDTVSAQPKEQLRRVAVYRVASAPTPKAKTPAGAK